MADMSTALSWIEIAWKGATALAVVFYVPMVRSLDRLASRIDQGEQRLTALEREMKALPTDEHISELHNKINKVAEDVAKLSGTSESNEVLLRAIHQKVMNWSVR